MQSPPCRILCVDDDHDTCEVMCLLLTQAGHDVTVAHNRAEALRLAVGSHFDLYVLDTRLADSSGVELCRRLRALAPDAIIIFYSGAAYDADHAQGLDAGAQAYVVKPYINQLLATIQRLLPACAEATV